MRLQMLMLLLFVSEGAIAADSADRQSPVDRNAACMDRTVDSSTTNCVVQQDGTPRRTYPPKPAAPAPAPRPSAAAPAGTVRGSTGSK